MLKLYILERFISHPPSEASVCFTEIAAHISRHLIQAQSSICIAVCWFSHQQIFDALMNRLRAGISVEFLLEYDTQNIRPDGLDFQFFIQKGGLLFGNRGTGLMHHKFAIIDHRILLTGSFNWTYNTNAENIIVFQDLFCVEAFRQEYQALKKSAKRILHVDPSDAKQFVPFPLFENTLFTLPDLRRKIGSGTNVWVIKAGPKSIVDIDFFNRKRLCFDAQKLLKPYWVLYRKWSDTLFESVLEECDMSPGKRREIICWTRRVKIGDLVMLTENKSPVLLAIGIVQSVPKMHEGVYFSTYREVQWLHVMLHKNYPLPETAPMHRIGKYKGSALRVLQEVMGEKLM